MKMFIKPIHHRLRHAIAVVIQIVVDCLFMSMADVYRVVAAVMDWRCHLRVMSGKGKYDVAFINNLENNQQKLFLGIRHSKKKVAYSLRFSLGGSLCRSLLINRSARELAMPNERQLAKLYTRDAITIAVRDGARIILFAAGTKRLFSEFELAELRKEYPDVIFTIGDNGTALALLADVSRAIRLRELNANSRIAILGPNGFLGEVTTRFLKAHGYNNLLLLSSSMEAPFANASDVELVIACSHHARLKLTAPILGRISSDRGAYIIDVCRPCNLSRREFTKCRNIVRQDSGMVHNASINFVFPLGAMLVLRRLGISTRIMYGCFGEAVALSVQNEKELGPFDFLSVNTEAMQYMEQAFTLAGFAVSPVHNFGKATCMAAPAARWEIARYL